MGRHLLVDRAGEDIAIDRQRCATGHPGRVGTGKKDAPQGAQLGLEQAVRVGEIH
jgi:hypothetical protein